MFGLRDVVCTLLCCFCFAGILGWFTSITGLAAGLGCWLCGFDYLCSWLYCFGFVVLADLSFCLRGVCWFF